MEENNINNIDLKLEPKIVVIGGGTGLSILLRGLKKFTHNITAIVTVSDDGGGSGVLREDLGMLPPGDIRACLLALANTEPSMEKLLRFRFKKGILNGQSFGNLLLAAMNEIYGSFEMAVKETSNVLAVTGKVFPMTLENTVLFAELDNGMIVEGESKIPLVVNEMGCRIERVFIEPKLSNPLSEAVDAIRDADLIVLGPGSLFTSILPNLLIKNIVEDIYNSAAPKVYIGNVMTQPGETTDFSLSDHVRVILNHSRPDFLDYVIGNTEVLPLETVNKYISDRSAPVIATIKDEEFLKLNNIQLIAENLIDVRKTYIRHNNIELSKVLIDIAKGKR